jgi:hypothetical protein
MPVIADTAYPHLTSTPRREELDAFTPSKDEISFALRHTRQPVTRLALLIYLKTFQRLGYFVQLREHKKVGGKVNVLSPQSFESNSGGPGIPYRVGDILVSEVILHEPRIVTTVR